MTGIDISVSDFLLQTQKVGYDIVVADALGLGLKCLCFCIAIFLIDICDMIKGRGHYTK